MHVSVLGRHNFLMMGLRADIWTDYDGSGCAQLSCGANSSYHPESWFPVESLYALTLPEDQQPLSYTVSQSVPCSYSPRACVDVGSSFNVP